MHCQSSRLRAITESKGPKSAFSSLDTTLNFLVNWTRHLTNWCFSFSHLLNGDNTSLPLKPLYTRTLQMMKGAAAREHTVTPQYSINVTLSCVVTPTKEHSCPQKHVNSNPAAMFQLLDLCSVHFNGKSPLYFSVNLSTNVRFFTEQGLHINSLNESVSYGFEYKM